MPSEVLVSGWTTHSRKACLLAVTIEFAVHLGGRLVQFAFWGHHCVTAIEVDLTAIPAFVVVLSAAAYRLPFIAEVHFDAREVANLADRIQGLVVAIQFLLFGRAASDKSCGS